LGDFGAAALKLDGGQIAGSQLGEQVGELNGDRVRPVHDRRKAQRVELAANGVDNAAVVVAGGDDINAREGGEVTPAAHVPVIDAVSAGHDQGMLRPLGHLVADENVAEETLLCGLSIGDYFGEGGGHLRTPGYCNSAISAHYLLQAIQFSGQRLCPQPTS